MEDFERFSFTSQSDYSDCIVDFSDLYPFLRSSGFLQGKKIVVWIKVTQDQNFNHQPRMRALDMMTLFSWKLDENW